MADELVSASWIQWLGGGIAILYMTLLGIQQRRMNKLEDKMDEKLVTHDQLDDMANGYNERFNTRREAVEQRISDQNERINQLRDDFKATERRLTDEIRSSENRLIAAFTKYRGE